jgi:progranulin
MHTLSTLLSLPTGLLSIIASFPIVVCAEAQWPYNLAPHEKYYPEDEAHIKREADILRRMEWSRPRGIKKMSLDEGEKFFLDYWHFEEEEEEDKVGSYEHRSKRSVPMEDPSTLNDSAVIPFHSPFSLHKVQKIEEGPFQLAPRDLLWIRDFQCPVGTQSCAGIGRPDSCCSLSDACILIQDTGIGDVGCCPKGQTCSGSVSSCDTGAGFSSCPGSSNGGCCIPNYVCQGIGCK